MIHGYYNIKSRKTQFFLDGFMCEWKCYKKFSGKYLQHRIKSQFYRTLGGKLYLNYFKYEIIYGFNFFLIL